MMPTSKLLGRLAVRIRGKEHELHPLRLRLADPSRVTPNGQRLFEITDILNRPQSYEVRSSAFSEQKGLDVMWADGAESNFSSAWLEGQTCSGSDSATSLGKQYLWNSKFRKFLPEVTHSEILTEGGKALLSSHLHKYGISLIRSVPCESGMVLRVGDEIGEVRRTNYGDLFDVVDRGPEANNLAMTNCRILAHTDNPYRDPYPGIQMLHCLEMARQGGATTFTDGFAAAAQLRQRDPEAFRLLTKYRHPYEYRDPSHGVLLRAAVPVITLDAKGCVERICFNNRSAGVLELPDSELEAYYQAWTSFDKLCNDGNNVMTVLLGPGDLAIWSNGRVMHGREQYTAGAGRHIQGCYIDHDAVRSRYDWKGVPDLGDVHSRAADETIKALETQDQFSYGEGISMLQHALQAAHCARLQGEGPAAILAALMHDVGNAPQARAAWEAAGNPPAEMMISQSDNSIGYRFHADIGAEFVESLGFSPEVAGAVRLHLSAKRALVAMDPAYMNELSQASKDTLAQQGGPMTAAELEQFRQTAGSDVALRLRRYDDQGKVPGAAVAQLDQYKQLICKHLEEQSAGFAH